MFSWTEPHEPKKLLQKDKYKKIQNQNEKKKIEK